MKPPAKSSMSLSAHSVEHSQPLRHGGGCLRWCRHPLRACVSPDVCVFYCGVRILLTVPVRRSSDVFVHGAIVSLKKYEGTVAP